MPRVNAIQKMYKLQDTTNSRSKKCFCKIIYCAKTNDEDGGGGGKKNQEGVRIYFLCAANPRYCL